MLPRIDDSNFSKQKKERKSVEDSRLSRRYRIILFRSCRLSKVIYCMRRKTRLFLKEKKERGEKRETFNLISRELETFGIGIVSTTISNVNL